MDRSRISRDVASLGTHVLASQQSLLVHCIVQGLKLLHIYVPEFKIVFVIL